jgi:mRNA degradation ribonuclease J1/J2
MAAPVRIIFLGGLGEIGRNCMVIEQDNRLLLALLVLEEFLQVAVVEQNTIQ